MREGGPVKLWERIERVLDAYDAADRPGPEPFSLHVHGGGQHQRHPQMPGLHQLLQRDVDQIRRTKSTTISGTSRVDFSSPHCRRPGPDPPGDYDVITRRRQTMKAGLPRARFPARRTVASEPENRIARQKQAVPGRSWDGRQMRHAHAVTAEVITS
ncbi:hypothetical protein ACIQGO_34390 [Streptomyces shenzhenensis]|uniref:hypothetical protein n=1 Tax=Streptomyces shenzhenensis TaxID=943815 RepID=UPI003816F7CE